MKKRFLILLALVLCLAMAGCGAQDPDPQPADADTDADTDLIPGDASSIQAIPAFASTDAYGQPVTDAIFRGKDVTMINVWGTFCPPCINEMPELEKISQALPENAQMLGLVLDVPQGDADMTAAALEIIEGTGVTYPSILISGELEPLLYCFQYVPTTLFVDGEGKVIAAPVIGASPSDYVATLESLLEGWTYEG